ncbi:MAG TPA: hypothetical protein VLT47_06545 [Anaeromyxobacteraceae bacterium]|nr:hypothetical protein [Anaeromyxobacteraceae bacterium]
MEPLDQLLAHDAAWHPPRAEADAWIAEALRLSGPPSLLHEARWWQAREAARGGDWERVTALAGEGLGEPFSEREAVRLALLHALSGDLDEAAHVLAQAVQWRSGEELLARFAELCEAEGLPEAAARFRRFSGRGGSPPPSPAAP